MGIPIPKVDSFSYLGERRYQTHHFVPLLSAVFMYQAAPAAVAKLINPLPEVAGVR
jgi:hypothetical protein